MTTIETVNTGHASRGHTHRTQAEAERCPLCGSPISAETRARLDEKRNGLDSSDQIKASRIPHNSSSSR